jgi:hypothetical protein
MLAKLARNIAGRLSGRYGPVQTPNARALNSRGLTLHREDDLDAAQRTFEAAIAADPALPEPRVNLANVFQDRGEPERALEYYEAALKLRGDLASAHYGRATTLLALGRYDEGWREYEWRWGLEGAETAPEQRFGAAVWNAQQPLAGKRIFLWAEQGFGDVIQFARYAPLVAARGAEVVIGCQSELSVLLRSLDGVAAVLSPGDPVPPFDYHSPLMSLPYALRAETIPAAVPYLRASEDAVSAWRSRLRELAGDLTTVGVAWAGNPGYVAAKAKALPLIAVAELARTAGCAFVSLQKGASQDDLATLARAGAAVHDWTHEFRDFADTAACVSALDVVVSIDTAVAHLAGALGKPVHTLLPRSADWRWGLNGDVSSWYPTMRLYRQQTPARWNEPVAAVKAALTEQRHAR